MSVLLKNKRRNKSLVLLFPAALIIGVVFLGCMKEREPNAPTPIERPQLSGNFKPANGELKIKLNETIKIFFTHAMDVKSLPDRFFVQDYNGNKIEGKYSTQDAAAIFTPDRPMDKNSIYKVTLKGRVRDIYGNSIYHNGNPVLNDTTLILSGWFYTEGGYSEGGYNHIFAVDKSNIFVFDSLNCLVSTLQYSGIMTGYSVSEDCSCFLVSSGSTNSIDFINLQTGNIETTLPVSKNPQTIIVQGNFAYVVCPNGKAIEKINVALKSIEKTYALDFFPGEIAVSTDGNYLYTIDQAKKDLVIIDAVSGSAIQRVPGAVTSYSNGDIKTDGSKLYICDTKGNKLNVLDQNNSIASAYQFTSDSPVNLCYDDISLYVAAGSSIYKLNKQTYTADVQITFQAAVRSLTILPSKDILYVVTNTSAVIIDLKTFSVLEEIVINSISLQEVISSPIKF